MTSRNSFTSIVCLGLVASVGACSGSDAGSPTAGGATSAGGSSSNGGVTGIGGLLATGGITSSAGAPTTGGKANTGGAPAGGSIATGGTPSAAGGAPATGGAPTAGGSIATGGAATNGGVAATGGINATGGVVSTGGSKAVGGTSSAGGTKTGGAPSTGGSKAVGGAASTGGSKAAGGTTATGGSTSVGGTSNSPGCGATALPAACNTATTGPCTLTVGGTARQYFVVLPANYNANTPYPVVFAWHGRGGTAQSLLGSTYYAGFYGVKTGFPNAIYVTAQGLDSGQTDSGTDYGWPNTNGQDVNFTKAMIDWLESSFCVDKSRLYSTGMSYGGIMSNTLACQMSDVFRAIGVMSGSLFNTRGVTCGTHPIGAWFTHGDADTTVPIAGDITARDLFIKNNGCDTTNTQSATMSDGVTVCTIYNVCTAGPYPVVWCPVAGEGHTIPNWAGAEIAKFFLQF